MAQSPNERRFQELWTEAAAKYEADTQIKLATHPLVGCNSPDAVLAVLDRDLKAFNAYCDRKEELQKHLKPMLHLIGSLSKAAGEVVSVLVPFANAGFVALGVLVEAAKNVSARYDCIIDLCEVPNVMREVVIQMLVHLMFVFALVTKEIKQTRIGSYLRALIGRTDVQDAVKRFRDLIEAEQSMGVAQAMVFSQEILDCVHGLVVANTDSKMILTRLEGELQKAMQSTVDVQGQVQQQLSDLQITMTGTTKELGDLNRRHLSNSVRLWLKAPDARTNHNTARHLHEGDTGSWLLRSFKYKSWKSTSSSLFWINGKPGAGKTIICSTVIEDLLATSPGVIAYFYFNYGEADKRCLRGMLSSIISQLEEQLSGTPSPLLALYQKLGAGAHEPSIAELTACLESLIITLSESPVFIVLDALDEYSNPDELAPVLKHLMEWVPDQVHIFVTSRPEDIAVKVLGPFKTHELDLSSVIQGDISLYLRRIMSEELPFQTWKQVHRDLTFNHLLEHSNGMFRWVTCQLTDIRKCLLRDLQATLSSLPATLDETYERILSQIHATNKPHARRLFNWLAFSSRPLYVEELAQVVAINFVSDGSASFEEDYIEPDAQEVISRVCSSLVHMTSDGTVQFAHFSVREFLMSERIRSMPQVASFEMEAETAHTVIAASCLAYLLWVGSVDNIPMKLEEIQGQYPLTEYSVKKYADHAQFGRVSEHVQDMLAALFIVDTPQWTFWVSHNDERNETVAGTPLYWAARLGFLKLASLMLAHDADVNAQGGEYGNALQAASAGGHLALAELLLGRGADVNTQGGYYSNALYAASDGGHIAVVQLLLAHKADVNAQGGYYGNALQAALCEDHLAIAELLLAHGADVNNKGGYYYNALQAALEHDHLAFAKLLVAHGADVNAQGGLYRDSTALQVVSAKGHIAFAELLLAHGADVNEAGRNYGTPLSAASGNGHLTLVQLLLAHNADVNRQGRYQPSALQAAAAGGHAAIVQQLLKQGADVNAFSAVYENALHAASKGGHLEVQQLLLEHGAKANPV